MNKSQVQEVATVRGYGQVIWLQSTTLKYNELGERIKVETGSILQGQKISLFAQSHDGEYYLTSDFAQDNL